MVYGTSPETTPRDTQFIDSGNNIEYLQVMFKALRILLGTKRCDEKFEIRERAGSRQIATALQKHDICSPASRHRFPKLVKD